MISTNLPPQDQDVVDMPIRPATDGPYVDWAAILAGGVFALSVSFVLIGFGASLGLSQSSPYRGEGVSAAWLAIAAGIWFAWVMVTSFGAGGYICGRMRRHAGDAKPNEVEVRDGAHGLMVWAVGALFSIVLAATGAAGLVSAGTSAVGTATDVAAEAVSSDYFANVMLRNAATGSEAGSSASDTAYTADDADDADTAATSIEQVARDTAEVLGIDPAIQQEIASIIARSATSGEMLERDRSFLAQIVAANTGLDEAAARARVDEVNAEIDDARGTALDAVEKARVTGVVFGFIAAATMLIGAAAAFFAATLGGRHRDEGLGLDVLTARR